MPRDIEQMIVMRIVVRQGMSRDMADMLLADIRNAVAEFEQLEYPTQSRLKFERSEHQTSRIFSHTGHCSSAECHPHGKRAAGEAPVRAKSAQREPMGEKA